LLNASSTPVLVIFFIASSLGRFRLDEARRNFPQDAARKSIVRETSRLAYW
jgi:hypothetical protein